MKYIKSGINYSLVIVFVVLGFVGLVIPLVPQAVFFAIAIMILSFEYPPLERYVEKKLPKDGAIGKVYFKIKDQFAKYLK